MEPYDANAAPEAPIRDEIPGTDAALQLRRGMRLVHDHFVKTVIACMFAAVFCFPRLGDGARAHTLRDLRELMEQLDVSQLKAALAREAERNLAVDLTQLETLMGTQTLHVAEAYKKQRFPLVTATPPDLQSLRSIALAAQPDAHVLARGPSFDALRSSLRWRIERSQARGPLTLTDLRRTHPMGADALAVEARVAPARAVWEKARVAHESARQSYFALREASDALTARGASKRALKSATRERVAAWESFEATRLALETARSEYDKAAQQALALNLGVPSVGDAGVLMIATFQTEEKKTLEISVPVPILTQRAAIVALAPPALRRLEQDAYWEDIRTLTPEAAAERLEGELSFHLFEANLLGLPISGLTMLQLLPLLLGLMVGLLIWRCREAMRRYAPFGYSDLEIPSPGTGRAAVDYALLIAPPSLLLILTCWTLVRVDARPWFALLFYLILIALSAAAAQAMTALENVRTGVRHRSLVPPLPVRMDGEVNPSLQESPGS